MMKNPFIRLTQYKIANTKECFNIYHLLLFIGKCSLFLCNIYCKLLTLRFVQMSPEHAEYFKFAYCINTLIHVHNVMWIPVIFL